MSRASEEYKSSEERKIGDDTTTTSSSSHHSAKEAAAARDANKAEVFSTGWMHTDITGHPFDTRGLYGPKGVKFTPAPGERLPDGRKVVQATDDSITATGAAVPPTGFDASTTTGAAAAGAGAGTAATRTPESSTTSSSSSTAAAASNENIWRPEPMKAEDRHKLAEKTRADAEKDAELARKRLEKELPNAPPLSKNDQRTFINRYVPVGSNGYFARPSFEEELLSHISKRRNRMGAIEQLERNLDIKMMGFIREWRSDQIKEREQQTKKSLEAEAAAAASSNRQFADSPMSSSSLSSSSSSSSSSSPVKIVTEGEIKITTLPTTVTTSRFEGGGYSGDRTSFAEHASQRAPATLIETHKAPIVDSSPVINSSESAEAFRTQASSNTSRAPFIENDLSNRMAATTIGSGGAIPGQGSTRQSASSAAVLGNEQAFSPELTGQGSERRGGAILNEGEFIDNRLQQESMGAPISVGQTPLGPSGSPYKSGVDSKYVDLNAQSTGFMHTDVTGFPYDTRGIAGERGINADIVMAEKQRQAELGKANKNKDKDVKDQNKDRDVDERRI